MWAHHVIHLLTLGYAKGIKQSCLQIFNVNIMKTMKCVHFWGALPSDITVFDLPFVVASQAASLRSKLKMDAGLWLKASLSANQDALKPSHAKSAISDCKTNVYFLWSARALGKYGELIQLCSITWAWTYDNAPVAKYWHKAMGQLLLKIGTVVDVPGLYVCT